MEQQTKIELTNEVSNLIKYIAKLQIQSFQKILSGSYIPDSEDLELLKQVGANWSMIYAEAKVKLEHYMDMQKEPLLLGASHDIDLAIMRHMLFNIEDELMDAHKFSLEDINKLWDIFFQIETDRRPRLRIYNKARK